VKMILLQTGVAIIGALVLMKLALQVLSNWARITNIIKSFWDLYTLPEKKVQQFMASYDLFEREKVTNDDSLIVDYYSVLNNLCAIGEVEKMYIPPTMDPKLGVFDNQVLFERKMMRDLDIPKDAEKKTTRSWT